MLSANPSPPPDTRDTEAASATIGPPSVRIIIAASGVDDHTPDGTAATV